tara:strand:+ start:78 stop:1292 length:1215 start_codon:yes stop_codon:yes gene_type:complete
MRKFPEGFYWGAATSGYQVEGWGENTDWATAARTGKVPPAGRLCDHYHLFENDFALAKELGHNAHRFGVEWARIEPSPGEFDYAEIEHYRQVLKSLHKNGMEPFITLWHFTLPAWFAESGGFERDDAHILFARYAKFVIEELGDLCTHFATINEPNVWAAHGYLFGAWPPFKRASLLWKKLGKDDGSTHRVGAVPGFVNFLRYRQVEKKLILAHQEAYKAIKLVAPDVQVSLVKHIHVFRSNWNPLNWLRARVMNYLQSGRFLNAVRDYMDEYSVNYYRHTKYGDKNKYPKSDMGWDMYPEGIYYALLSLKKYSKPVYVSEAGVADEADAFRSEYIKKQVEATAKAIEEGVDVRGHMYWSLLDNYEWALGIDKKFGLIAIDYGTLARTPRPSAYVYQKLIEANS